MSECENCDRPLATEQDAKDFPPGEGEHLCWGACEPEDWRARALKAEQQMRELAEVAARNVNDAQHLQRERDEARRYAEERNDEANKLQRILNMAAHERDEARAEVKRLRFVEDCRSGGLTYECNLTRPCVACRLRTVAERQREADIDHCLVWLGHANVGVPLDQFMRETPLVTEGEP